MNDNPRGCQNASVTEVATRPACGGRSLRELRLVQSPTARNLLQSRIRSTASRLRARSRSGKNDYQSFSNTLTPLRYLPEGAFADSRGRLSLQTISPSAKQKHRRNRRCFPYPLGCVSSRLIKTSASLSFSRNVGYFTLRVKSISCPRAD